MLEEAVNFAREDVCAQTRGVWVTAGNVVVYSWAAWLQEQEQLWEDAQGTGAAVLEKAAHALPAEPTEAFTIADAPAVHAAAQSHDVGSHWPDLVMLF